MRCPAAKLPSTPNKAGRLLSTSKFSPGAYLRFCERLKWVHVSNASSPNNKYTIWGRPTDNLGVRIHQIFSKNGRDLSSNIFSLYRNYSV